MIDEGSSKNTHLRSIGDNALIAKKKKKKALIAYRKSVRNLSLAMLWGSFSVLGSTVGK